MILPGAQIPYTCSIEDDFGITATRLRFEWRLDSPEAETQSGTTEISIPEDSRMTKSFSFEDVVELEALKKSRQLLRKSQRLNPQAKLVVSGCYASREPENLNQIDGVDLLVPNQDKDRLVEIVHEQLLADSMPINALEAGDTHLFTRARTRAFVKVQDGCRYRCAFCISPSPGEVKAAKPLTALLRK